MSAAASIWSPSVLWSFFSFKWQHPLAGLYRHVYCQHDFIVIMRLMKVHLQVFLIEKSKRFQIINVEQHEISFPRIHWPWFCVMAQLWFQTHRLNAALLWILHVLKWLSAQWSGSDCFCFFCLFVYFDWTHFYKVAASGCCSAAALCKDTESTRLNTGLFKHWLVSPLKTATLYCDVLCYELSCCHYKCWAADCNRRVKAHWRY